MEFGIYGEMLAQSYGFDHKWITDSNFLCDLQSLLETWDFSIYPGVKTLLNRNQF